MNSPTTGGDLLREGSAGEYLDVPPATLKQWRYLGKGPRYVKLSSKHVRYRRADLDAFIAANAVNPQGAA